MLGDDKTSTFTLVNAGTVIQQFTVVDQIGVGGMGEVFLAEDSRLHRRVALKFLPVALSGDQQFIDRFIREAQAAARLNHPSIVVIYEVGEYCKRPFFAMELIEGVSLHALIQQRPLPVDEAASIARQIMEGLVHAHGLGVVHRDIKASNIIINKDGRVKLLDFGLAAIAGSARLTSAGSTLGTIAYMAPEQIRGQAADHRCDLFSCGVLLYELLTGKLPFRRDNDAATMHAILQEAPEPLSRLRSGIPDDWQRVADRALQKDPSMRYQTAADMLADIKRISQVTSMPSMKIGDGRKVMAILPFESIGPADQEYFADGITDEITSRLAKLKDVTVISSSSSQQYKKTTKRLKEIGQELGAGYLLQGTIRWDNSGPTPRVRINAKLVRVDDDSYLWAETYDRVLDHIFALQADIASRVADALGSALSGKQDTSRPSGATTNLQAYELYLKASEKFPGSLDPQDMSDAIRLYQEAIKLDPNYAVAYARLGMAQVSFYHFFSHNKLHVEQSKSSIDKAFQLAPGLLEAHLALAEWYFQGKRDFDRAIEQFEIVYKAEPNNAAAIVGQAFVHRRQGKWQQSVDELKRGIELDPRNVVYPHQVATSYLYMRQFDQALKYMDRALWLKPDLGDSYQTKAWTICGLTGDMQAAAEVGRSAIGKAPLSTLVNEWEGQDLLLAMFDNNPERVLDELDSSLMEPPLFLVSKAQLYERLGKHEVAQAYLDSARVLLEMQIHGSPEDFRAHCYLGACYALLGNREKALASVNRAADICPMSHDALFGTTPLDFMAKVRTFLGDYDEAVELIHNLLQIPSWYSAKVLPYLSAFESLHNHPRFRQLAGMEPVEEVSK